MRRIFSALALLLLALMVACSGPRTTQAPREAALLSDADLASAALRPGSSTVISQASAVNLARQSTLERNAPELQSLGADAALSVQSRPGSFSDTGGYVAYAQTHGDNHQIRLVGIGNEGGPGHNGHQLVYKGSRAIDSVAVSADGGFMVFVAETEDGNNDLYFFDLAGRQGLQRLATSASESNVSMSLDGSTVVWETVNPGTGTRTLGVLTVATGEGSIFNFGPFDVTEPSVSGNGNVIALLVSDPAAPDDPPVLATLDLTSSALTGIYAGDLSNPSLSYDGNLVLLEENFGGDNFLSLIDIAALTLTDLLGLNVEHPYLSADGDFLTFGFGGSTYVGTVDTDDPGAAIFEALQDPAGTVNTAMYWAKELNYITYSGINDDGPFTRPDAGEGLSDEERTVFYDAFEFVVSETDYYEILSSQNYDGYLNLYQAPFNPDDPESNLLAGNDDFGGGFDSGPPPVGNSRIVYLLEADTPYVLVTSACGDPDAGCGPDTGNFTNTIEGGAPAPLPPDILPEPDDSRYNITVRFAGNDVTQTLTDAQKQVFIDAAERWAAVITADLQNIEGFSLPQDFSFVNTPPVEGTVDDLLIDVAFQDFDGPSGLLGRAGPRFIRAAGTADESLSIYGIMEFDIGEFAEGGFFNVQQQYEDVIVHEMGHVIGIGTLWELTGNTEGILSDPPTVPAGLPNPDYDPRFIGAGAVAEYQTLITAAGYEMEDSVPIANTGGPGNYNGHWREITFDNELMTPYAGGVELLSRMTAASLGDLGYTVSLDSPAVDQDYVLPPPRVPGVFRQIAPEMVDYVEAVDFLAASDSVKAIAEGAVTNVDLNLGDVANSTSGCEASDFTGFPAGSIALVRRGTCNFDLKANNAEAAGATAVIIMNQGNAEDRMGLMDPALPDQPGIPVIFVTYDLGVELANTAGLEVHINTGVDTTMAPAMVAPSFEEILLEPIGTVSPNGKITPIH